MGNHQTSLTTDLNNQDRFPKNYYHISHYELAHPSLPKQLSDSVTEAITLLTNPKESALNSLERAHCYFRTTLGQFNNINYKCNTADLISQIKLIAPKKITAKLSVNQIHNKQLLANFKLVLESEKEYVYQCQYFNSPDSSDVLLNQLLLFNFLEIEISQTELSPEEINNIRVEYIGTYLNISKRKALYLSDHYFHYPERTFLYQEGVLSVLEKIDNEIENQYDYLDLIGDFC